MKTPPELRTIQNWDLRAEPVNMRVSYLSKSTWDLDVYLPTKGVNLQRPLVWADKQKGELVYSVFAQRYIPDIYCIALWDMDMYYQVIDGKQRLNALMGFLNDEFPVVIEGQGYLFSELPIEYQRFYKSYSPCFRIIHEGVKKKITDEQKIRWFTLINFGGTPQDEAHIEMLKGL